MISSRNLFPLLALSALPASLCAQSRPNIVLFLVDDMGWQETSVPFWHERTPLNDRYRTPNMERLAQMGVKFTNAYACAVSSPSRCSLMSGMNAARHRVTNWTLSYDKQTDSKSDVISVPDWNYNGIQPADADAHDSKNAARITPLPQVLHNNGYYTIHCGKAHFAAEGTAGEDPLRMGFDVNIAGAANGAPASYLAENEYGSGPFHVKGLEKYYGTGIFLTEALTREALAAMQKPIAEKQPFFLYMSHYAIHVPYDADPRFTGNYRQADGQGVFDNQLQAHLSEPEINHAALVEGMDKSLGDILDFLQTQPEVAQNTIILFMSDNGGQAIWPRQGRRNIDQNWPAHAGKGSAYEGGIHEPMIAYVPGQTKGGTVNDNRIIIEDFYPTILDMAGIKQTQVIQHIDGVSFADLLKKPRKHRARTLIWHYPNIWTDGVKIEDGYGAYSAIMHGDYHLIYFWETQEYHLFNIRTDIGEQHNLAQSQPKLVQKLAKRLTRLLKSADAQRPTLKATGQPVPWPDEV